MSKLGRGRWVQWRRLWVALCCAGLLSACGGGGGGASGGGGSTPTPPTPPAPPSTDPGPASLVPLAPALGAVLETDATALLPQVSGAEWRFWGRQTSAAGTEVALYETTYSLSQVGVEWRLKATNQGNDGADETRYQIADGQVQQIESVQFTAAQPAEEIRFAVLRSPVRVGDQVVAYNKRVASTLDLDGDGLADSIDIAVYVRVVGRESVDAASGEKLDAIRVETHLLQRALYSKTNQPGPVSELIGIEWFVRGLGWVARQEPTVTSDGQILTGREQLVGVEAAEKGYGTARPRMLANPANSPEQPGQPLSLRSPSAVINAGQALLISDPPIGDFSGSKLLTLLNNRGEVQWTRRSPPGIRFGSPLGTGWLLWGNLDDGMASVFRIDGQGNALSSAAQVLDMGGPAGVTVGHRAFALAAGAQGLWVAAIRQDRVTDANGTPGFRDGIVVRGFDLDGQPRTPALLLERSDQGGFLQSRPSLAVSGGAATLSWNSAPGGDHIALVHVDASGQPSGVAISDGVTASTASFVVGAAGGVLLTWGFDSRTFWVDGSVGRTPLDSTRPDGTLPAWPSGLSFAEQRVLQGDSLLRWGGETNAVNGSATRGFMNLMRWQLYRRGQAAPTRHSLVSNGVGLNDTLIVPMADRMFVLSRPVGSQGMGWALETVYY